MQAVLKARRMIGELGSTQLQKILWQWLWKRSPQSELLRIYFFLNAFQIANLGPRKCTDAGEAKQGEGRSKKKNWNHNLLLRALKLSQCLQSLALVRGWYTNSKNEKNGKNVENSPRSKMAEKNRKKWKIGPIFHFSATFPLLDWGEFSTFFPFFPILEFGLSSSPARLQPKPPKISENRFNDMFVHNFGAPLPPTANY